MTTAVTKRMQNGSAPFVSGETFRRWFDTLAEKPKKDTLRIEEGNSLMNSSLIMLMTNIGSRQGAARLDVTDAQGTVVFSLAREFDWSTPVSMNPYNTGDPDDFDLISEIERATGIPAEYVG